MALVPWRAPRSVNNVVTVALLAGVGIVAALMALGVLSGWVKPPGTWWIQGGTWSAQVSGVSILGSSNTSYLIQAYIIGSGEARITKCVATLIDADGVFHTAEAPPKGCDRYGTVCCDVEPTVVEGTTPITIIVTAPAGWRLAGLQLVAKTRAGESVAIVLGAVGGQG